MYISSQTKMWRLILLLFVLACFGIGAISFQYYYKLQKTIQEESTGYLQEISRRMGDNINRIINDNYFALETIVAIMEENQISSFDKIESIINVHKKNWNYQDIMLITENGTAYSASGGITNINSTTYFRDAVINKQHSMSTTQMINNQECTLLAVPVGNLKVGSEKIVALAASYLPTTFSDVLCMSAFNGSAYSHIIDKNGNLIIQSTSEVASKTGYNVLNTIGESKIDDGGSIQRVKYDIQNDISGKLTYWYENEQKYMVYTPIMPDDWYLLTFVPMSAVNEKTDILLKITLMVCGLITLLFAALVACLAYGFLRNRRDLERIAFVDPVTGGHTIQKFYELAAVALEQPQHPKYALIYTNFTKFKILNEQFGHSICNEILLLFNKVVSDALQNEECIGRLTADNFCILIEVTSVEKLIERFESWYKRSEQYISENKTVWTLPVTEVGVYLIDNESMPFSQMIDRAKLALREVPNSLNSKLSFAVYNDDVRRLLFREKYLEDRMENALINDEFIVHLQPKYSSSDQKIGGAEALVRWNSVEEGMIFPDEFIPLFEKNGFIVRLDLWVFEQVCKMIRRWMDDGRDLIKVSVNCSRVHLRDPHFLKLYTDIADKYNVPKNMLEIELTESIVMEDAKRLSKIICDIHDIGFGCSMDDFGSGYSSLNLIRDIRVDTLKLDKIFFGSCEGDEKRTRSVIESIINMAKSLDMKTVAEGVECEKHVHMLIQMGCDYIQGYVFAKPMSMTDFEKLLFNQQKKED